MQFLYWKATGKHVTLIGRYRHHAPGRDVDISQ